MKTIRIAPSIGLLCTALILAWGLSASAGDVASLETFTPGDVADANDVNANFEALRSAVNDNDARVSSLENAPVTRSLTIPAGALNYDGTIVEPHRYGLLWHPQNFQVAGTIMIRRPADYAGGNLDFTIVIRTDFGQLAEGVVDFRVAAGSLSPGDDITGNTSLDAPGAPVAPNTSFGSVQTQTFTVPADRLTGEIWWMQLSRLGPDSTYPHDVIVTAVDLEYRARTKDP